MLKSCRVSEKVPVEKRETLFGMVTLIHDFIGFKKELSVVFLDKSDKDIFGETEIMPSMPDVKIYLYKVVQDGLTCKYESKEFKEAVITVVHEMIHASFKRTIAAVQVTAEMDKEKAMFEEMWNMIMEEETEELARGIAKTIIDLLIEAREEVEEPVSDDKVCGFVKEEKKCSEESKTSSEAQTK